MSPFVRAQAAPSHSIIYQDNTGKFYRFSGGTWAWRNNNPGNLVPGDISKQNHQIGSTKKFAIFASYEAGHQALLDCLKITYADSSIDDLVKAYAPAKDGNNIQKYTNFLRSKTGITDNKTVANFTPKEFDMLWHAIEQMEGYKAGAITEVFPIFEVYKNKQGIYKLHAKGRGWFSQQECIALVHKGELDLVVCTSHLGHKYVRARLNSIVNGNLDKMVIKDPIRGK
jgi:hypothetical protein